MVESIHKMKQRHKKELKELKATVAKGKGGNKVCIFLLVWLSAFEHHPACESPKWNSVPIHVYRPNRLTYI